jgi:hypothetical protein
MLVLLVEALFFEMGSGFISRSLNWERKVTGAGSVREAEFHRLFRSYKSDLTPVGRSRKKERPNKSFH